MNRWCQRHGTKVIDYWVDFDGCGQVEDRAGLLPGLSLEKPCPPQELFFGDIEFWDCGRTGYSGAFTKVARAYLYLG